MKSYKDLDVWKNTRKLVKTIYELTEPFPKSEMFGLSQQLRNCAISVPSCIAEGHGRRTAKDSIQFFHISKGSLIEMETQVYLSLDLNYINEEKANETLDKITTAIKMLNGLINYFEKLELAEKEKKRKSKPHNNPTNPTSNI